MPKPKIAYKDACELYLETLDRIISDLKSLVYEIESQVTTRVSDPFPSELVHDAVPIVRKIKTAVDAAEYSKFHFNLQLLKK